MNSVKIANKLKPTGAYYVKIYKNILDFKCCYDNIILQPQTVSVARLNRFIC